MTSRTLSTRATLPRDFFTTRRSYNQPYRTYSFGRRRPTPSIRDSAFRFIPSETELTWLKPDKPKEERVIVPDVTEVELATKLHIIGVDLHVESNTELHHTDMYECTESREVDGEKREAELVIRRGQKFKMTINFDRPYDIKKNDITFVFTLGDGAEGHAVVSEVFKLDESSPSHLNLSKWGAVITDKQDKSLTVSIFIPASAPVGEWGLGIRTTVDVEDGKDIVWEYNHNQEVIVLFNPWCKEDLVYLSDETWMKEVVLNDSGVLYYGTYKYIGAKKWHFGQFEDTALDASLHLLRKVFGFEATPAMGSVVRVVRALSKIVNSNDDAGVVIGRWGDDYEGGTAPTSWVGSIKILKEYMTTGAPVRFGQCWVFSGVLTTVCRSLGIPCRSITNFESAHNSDNSHLSCDVINILMSNGTWYKEKVDSVWNFHVWNEAWLSRPDLSTEEEGAVYDGWQVIDATPQERSEGVFQCGPSPISAIKEGLINVGSDTAFVFGEVNGDKVEWRADPKTGILCQVERIKNAIGKKMSTHEPTGEPFRGKGPERLDITDLYKYPEGSEKERSVVRKAERMFRFANTDVEEEMIPVEAIELNLVEKEYHLGSPMDFQVTARNTGDLTRTLKVSLEVLYNNYRRVTTGTAASKKLPEFQLKPGEEKACSIELDVFTSIKRPQDGYNFSFSAIAETKESENIVKLSSSARLIEPEIKVEGPASCKHGEVIEVTLNFTNPLPVTMSNCVLLTEGSLNPVAPSTGKMEIGDIKSGDSWTTSVKLKPTPKPKYRKIRDVAFSLSCYQLGTVEGFFTVDLIL